MDEDEAALLAELRAISAGSAASRFQDEEENNAGPSDNDKEIEEKEQLSSEPPTETKEKEEEPVYTNAPPPVAQSLSQSSSKTAPQSNQKQRPLPPWKKKAAQPKAAQDVDVVIAAPPAPATSLDDQPIGLKTQSTFQGERGGAAEDEDLLAELRAISGKSSAANRFADEENNNEHAVNGNEQPPEVAAPRKNNGPPKPEDIPPPKTIEKPPAPSSSNNMEKTKPDRHGMDILVSSRSEDQDIVSVLSEPSVFASGGFQKPSTPSQFKGERGGPAEDTELLAELQAISEKSKSSDRFAEENNEQNDNNEADEKPAQSTPPATTQPKRKTDELPPWKRKNSNAKPKSQPSDDDNIVVAAPPRPAPAPTPVPESGGFKKSDLPQTFQGDRGGTAEDEELLAELRAISSKSSSADRFAGDDDADAMELQTEPVMENPVPPKPKTKKPVAPSEEAELPPWKRKPQNAKPKDNDDFEVVVSAPPPPSKPATKESPMPDVGGFQKSNLPSTFTGERGGVAEDEALLAELRAVSSRSTGANRFEEDGNTGNEATADSSTPEPRETSAPLKPAPAAVNGKKDATLPPWKRKTQNAKPKEDFEVTISAPPALVKETVKEDPIPTTDSFQKESNLPNTFKGERGGAAEDEALLAELMAISSKSSGANRFAEEDAAAQPAPAPVQEEKQAALPPWKRKGQQSSKPTPSRDVDVVVSAPPAPAPAAVKKDPEPTMGGFQKESNLPNSFKGERGGAAEDEALLAELRAISSGAGGASRFQDNDNSEDAQAPPPAAPPKRQQPSLAPKPKSVQPNAAGGAPVGGPRVIETHQAAPSADAPEGNVTIDDFPGALSDKSWKTRKEAYGFLQTTLGNLVSGKEPANDIDAGSIVDGLDSLVPGMLGDNNAGALDAALQFAVSYADYSRGATASEQAGSMVGALVKGSALSSSRPSTTKLSSELVLKLVEVGENGTASAHAVVEVLLNQGLASRKPKVVMSSISLIHDAAIAFGAACLPIALITSSAPKFLSHSNAKVRDNGLKIIAEIARTLGSTSHIQGILDGMKKAQVDQLNAMIKEQSKPSPIGVGFRHESSDGPSSAEDALAALESGNAELEAKRFATRPAVNLIEEVAKSEYSARITHKKWSEKVAALDKVLECGGEKPYKLAEPSPSVKYGPLISEMKKLLGHTHFAVASKAMEVLSMLAEGAGEKLFPYLRPLVGTLFSLSKDKKLNKPVASCLDSFFGRIVSFEHLLEADALPEALDERKEKNALARSSTLDFLGRCVMRRDDAGPRGVLTADIAQNVAEMAVSKLEDSDAGVRKAALGVLQNLQLLEDETVAEVVSSVIEGIQKTNARAYKTLSRTMRPVSNKAADSSATKETTEGPKRAMGASQRKVVTNEPTATQELSTAPSQLLEKKSSRSTNRDSEPPKAAASAPVVEGASGDVPSLDEALEAASNLGIPNFDAPEEEGGVLEGLKSTKWLARQNAIKAFAAFLESEANGSPVEIEKTSGSLLIAVKEHTRGFKETNVNVTKAIMEFFLAVCDYHEKASYPLMSWAMVDFVTLSVEKISDKKLSGLAKGLLTDCCLVCAPPAVVLTVAAKTEQAKSPLPHEECQHWFKSFCNDFGASSLGKRVKDVAQWIIIETKSKNAKVKKAALASIGSLHVQLGPIFKALLMSQCDDSSRSEIEKTIDAHPFDPSCTSAEWTKVSIAGKNKSAGNNKEGGSKGDDDQSDRDMGIEIPRFDLFSNLPGDCVSKMGSKDGKTAWKLRKQAIDEVDAAVGKCSALLDTTSLKPFVELLRALRDRLSDSQGNLKPLAARVIGCLFAVMDKSTQAKLGKIVFAPLINATMTDIKKPMRDASLEALRQATTIASIEGGGLNEEVLDSFANAFASEINDTAIKAVGLPTLLDFVLSFAGQLPNLDKVTVARGQSLGEKFAHATVKCLTSSKSETRSKAEELLTICVENEVLGIERIKTCTERMKPAQQRSVGPFMAKLAKSVHTSSQGEKENLPDEDTREPEPQAVSKFSTRQSYTRKSDRTAPALRKDANREEPTETKTATHSHKTHSETPMHPLIGASGPAGTEKSRAALRSMTWPEYPEEPLGSDIYYQLKKAWSPVLPTSSASCFFPTGGIKNQDDGKPGCDLLAKAILMERAGEGVAIEEQLEFIFRWIILVLSSKEHTVGLQSLLTVVNDLFVYLQEIKYELSDSEAILFMPFVLEKASLAKGRFKEVYDDLLVVIKAEEAIPPKRLGSIVSVAMLERASHAKARALACQECARSVELLGLSGIGKKGVLVAAKALSEETLPENRNAVLDLMELVLSRMNGDVQRLARICGSNLSGKARSMVEERWQKRKANPPSSISKAMEDSSRRRSRIPTPQKSSPSEKTLRQSVIQSASSTTPTRTADGNTSSSAVLYDELPALNLRYTSGDSPFRKSSLGAGNTASNFSSSNFNRSKDSFGLNSSVSRMDESSSALNKSHQSMVGMSSSTASDYSSIVNKPAQSESSGAAASLRARLMAIRERSKNSEGAPATTVSEDKGKPSNLRNDDKSSPKVAPGIQRSDQPSAKVVSSNEARTGTKSSEFISGMDSIDRLVQKKTPLYEADDDLEAAIETSKQLHAALSKQQNVMVGLNPDELSTLRRSIVENVDEVIEGLSRLMRFSLNCEMPSRNAGISVSLLSVCLATLMALFRDRELAVQVSKDRLTILIRETGTALLDPRFAVSAPNSLDEATSSQVVRAINKLAVQAATGGSRPSSLSALMHLHRELSFEPSTFNARLVRVVTKLFTRVIKAEDAEQNPWESSDIDSILVSLDDHFHACNQAEESGDAPDADAIVACRNMAKSLVESVMKAVGGAAAIRDRMESFEMETLDLAKIVSKFDVDEPADAGEGLSRQEGSPSKPSKDVAALVSALGSAQTETERETALSNLRHYQLQHGEQDLNMYLEQVSPAFRQYILDQLNQHEKSSHESNMSERLRLLRSRLHSSSDAQGNVSAASSASSPAPKVQSRLSAPSPSKVTHDSSSTSIGAYEVPAPHIAAPSASSSVSSASRSEFSASQSLRERLAAAQENRAKSAVVPSDNSSTSGSRAAALRARLQAVKQQAMQHQ